ncbi:MAG: cation:proton antiporter [Candidatus Micrarchaeota archaeon]
MEFNITFGFEWILLFAILSSMISIKFKIPPVAGLLIAGAVIGPNALGLVELPTINLFAEIGATLLLFMIGIEFSISKLLRTGIRAILGGFILVTLMFVIMHEIAILIGFNALTALYIAAIFSFSSTAIMMKILEQKQLIERVEVPVLVAILIIEDIIAVFALTFFTELKTGSFTTENIFGAVVISLAVLGFFYVVLLNLLRKFSDTFLRYQTDDTLIMFSIALGIGMSILATMLGLTPAIGAFLAGSIIAGLSNGREFERSIKPFSRLFSSFFFLSIGMLIDPFVLIQYLDITLILVGVFLFSVFLVVTFTFYLISANGRSSFFAGLAMLPLGEFSLLLAKESIGITQINLVNVVSVGVLISSIICSLLVDNELKIYQRMKRTLPSEFLRILRQSSEYIIRIICAFEPDGDFHKLLVWEIHKLARDIVYLLGVVLLFLFAKPHLQFNIVILDIVLLAEFAFLLAIVALSLIPLIKLIFSLKRIFDSIAAVFSKTTQWEGKGAIIKNILASALFFALFANFNIIVEFAMLPRFFNWFSVVCGILSVFFFWSALTVVSSGFSINEEKLIDLLSIKMLKSPRKSRKVVAKNKEKFENVHPLLREYD